MSSGCGRLYLGLHQARVKKTEYFEVLDEVCPVLELPGLLYLLERYACLYGRMHCNNTHAGGSGRPEQADGECAPAQFVAAVTQRWPKVRCLSPVHSFERRPEQSDLQKLVRTSKLKSGQEVLAGCPPAALAHV